MVKRSAQSILEEHTANIKGLYAAFIGHRSEGMAIAAVNPTDVNINALAAYATELLRANGRLTSILGRGIPTSYIVSSTTTDKLLLQAIAGTDCFVAFLTAEATSFQESLPPLKAVLAECKEVLPKTQPPKEAMH